MIRNMVTSLLDIERIETTDAKAKEIRSFAEKIITLGKRGDLHARRRALRFVRRRDVVAKVFSELAERYRERQGGYTRIIKLGHRVGDNAQLSVLELIPAPQKGAGGRRTRRLRKQKGEEASAEAAPDKAAETEQEAASKEEAKKAPEKKKTAPKKEVPGKGKAKPKKEAAEKPAKPKKAAPKEKEKTETKKAAPKKKAEKPAPKTTKGKSTKSEK